MTQFLGDCRRRNDDCSTDIVSVVATRQSRHRDVTVETENTRNWHPFPTVPMTDRRLLRRYLALVRHADDMLAERLAVIDAPAPAEAVALLEDLAVQLVPAVAAMPARVVDAEEVRRELAGWVH
ncbi:MAG: hypothetical protein AB7L76_23465 [Burkholderiaceae bacterium]